MRMNSTGSIWKRGTEIMKCKEKGGKTWEYNPVFLATLKSVYNNALTSGRTEGCGADDRRCLFSRRFRGSVRTESVYPVPGGRIEQCRKADFISDHGLQGKEPGRTFLGLLLSDRDCNAGGRTA